MSDLISRSALIERIENLLAEMKGKLNEPAVEKVELSELEPGDVIETSFGEMIVLEHIGAATKIITKEFLKEKQKFDSNSPSFKTSEIRTLLNGDILKMFVKEFGNDNILPYEVKLTTVDMQQDYGTYTGRIRLITFDEAREFNELLVNEELPDWWWTMTPWSTKKRGWEYSVAVVSPSGYFDDNVCVNGGGVRPVCILKSNIFVLRKN